jgi:uncharacterized protein (UPF0264 family)
MVFIRTLSGLSIFHGVGREKLPGGVDILDIKNPAIQRGSLGKYMKRA